LRVRLLQSALKALDRVILKEIKLLLEAAAASRANDRFGHTPAARLRIRQMAAAWNKAAIQIL
jgi:hypothetical protein